MIRYVCKDVESAWLYDFNSGISFERCPIPYYIFYVCGNDGRFWEKIHEKVGLKTR